MKETPYINRSLAGAFLVGRFENLFSNLQKKSFTFTFNEADSSSSHRVRCWREPLLPAFFIPEQTKARSPAILTAASRYWASSQRLN
jgi:hypothetical protein